MKRLCYFVISFFIIAVLLVGCAKKEEAKKKERIGGIELGLKQYYVDTNAYLKPEGLGTHSKATTQSSADELATCSYDGMQMKKSAMQAKMEYKGKTLYFCTKEEMDKFKKNPEGYLSGKIKPKMAM